MSAVSTGGSRFLCGNVPADHSRGSPRREDIIFPEEAWITSFMETCYDMRWLRGPETSVPVPTAGSFVVSHGLFVDTAASCAEKPACGRRNHSGLALKIRSVICLRTSQ